MYFEPLSNDERDPFLENFAGELTAAAYQVMLRHGLGEKWLGMELDIWRALRQAINNRSRLHHLDLTERTSSSLRGLAISESQE